MISREFSRKLLITLFIGLFCATISWASQWTILGPDGGDVRSLSYDPHNPDHIFLGTSTGTIFSSTDGGRNWSRFAHLGSGDDYVLDHVAIDPQNPMMLPLVKTGMMTAMSGACGLPPSYG